VNVLKKLIFMQTLLSLADFSMCNIFILSLIFHRVYITYNQDLFIILAAFVAGS